jgi:hypothetical protein
LLSSAILYVAIVVIWAGVLIPRWLRRDSSDTAAAAAERAEAEAAAALDFAAGSAAGSASADSGVAEAAARVPGPGSRRRREAPQSVPDEPAATDLLAGEPLAGDPGHRRVLAARRRLLIMLLALSVASGVLAETRMAAWWVIVPPSVMLLGYLLLLREAARADTERREMARYRMDREGAERRSVPVAPVAHVAPVAAGPAAPAAAAAPAAKIIAFLPPPEEQIYDQYTDAKRRAVGDLRIPAPAGCHVSRAAQHPGRVHDDRGWLGQRRRCRNDAHLTTWVPQRRCWPRGRGWSGWG